jgi:Flp pilus assembly protein protease CpaA
VIKTTKMMYAILLTITFIALLIGSLTDIKTREVPDWLNYSLIFIGLGLRATYSSTTNDWKFFLEGIIGLGAFFTLAMFMFYAGQWGGGDSKMMMGIGALVGMGYNFDHMPLLVIFLVNLLLMGAVYGLIWSLALAITGWKKFTENYKKISENTKIIRRIVLITSALILLPALIVQETSLKISFAGLALITLTSYYLWTFAKSVEKSAMYRMVKPDKLTEGDWIAKEVNINGKYICGPKDLGIEKKQIQELKRLYKQKKIKEILVKDGIPFVPSFLLAFILTMLLGNWIILLF